MTKQFRRITALVAAVVLVATLAITAFAAVSVPKATSEFYANDFAGVLSSATEQHIINTSRALYEADGTQLVVATVDSLGGSPIEDYALAMSREWGIGSDEQDNGLLLLLSVGDREVRIEVGYGLEGVFNDAKAGRFIREAGIPYFSESKWDEGVTSLYGALVAELGNPTPLDTPEDEGGGWTDIVFAIIIVIVILVIFSGAGPTSRMRHYGGYGGYMGRGGFGGRGGGFGGGGGGSRGGGGGFGGGGASGRF